MKNQNIDVQISRTNLADYNTLAKNAAEDIALRVGKTGQFLNWIEVLPKNQLENIDAIYRMADEAKMGGFEEIAVLGIGGSRHTTESMMIMLGENAGVHFYSSIDFRSFERFAKTLNLDKTKFLVVSKSGGTLETTVAYQNAKKLLETKGYTNLENRFVAMTDASCEKSKLRQIVDAGDIKLSGLVHDDVGGRFSILDDATLFTMAFAGVSKEDTIKLLETAIEAQKEFLNPNIEENDALKLAVFNAEAHANGKIKHFVEYFGDAFAGATLWEKQMKNESLKAAISTDTNIGPGYLHYNAESDLDPNNLDSFFTFVYEKPTEEATKALLSGAMTAYENQHPVSKIILNDLSIETIARLIELKHFETIYTGNILRQKAGNIGTQDTAMPEVLQPNVEIYKKEVKKVLQ